jgi:hypothetical protein
MKVWFIAASESRRSWDVPAGQMKFPWQFLSSHAKSNRLLVEIEAACAMLVQLMRCRHRAVICGGYDSAAAWVCFVWSKISRRRFVLWLESNGRTGQEPGVLKNWLKRLFISGADGIAAAGTATVNYVRGLGARERKIFWAPMSVDNESFTRQASAVP